MSQMAKPAGFGGSGMIGGQPQPSFSSSISAASLAANSSISFSQQAVAGGASGNGIVVCFTFIYHLSKIKIMYVNPLTAVKTSKFHNLASLEFSHTFQMLTFLNERPKSYKLID